MSLLNLITRLDQERFDIDAEQLLDALWLASQGRDLSLHPPVTIRSGDMPEQGAKRAEPSVSQRGHSPMGAAGAPSALGYESGHALPPSESTPVFARGHAAPDEPTVRASLVGLPAPQALPDRLALMRSLRPLTRRWSSSQYLELDEQATVHAIAAVGFSAQRQVMPVFRPQSERWFEVELVLEEDASVELWFELLREFSDVLRESGAFRRVRTWRLHLGEGASPSYLENRDGARIPTTSLLGKAARRLIIFASNGASVKWSDGRYAGVLAPWIKDNAVLLLQLTAQRRWARSRLGDPNGVAWTSMAGAVAAALRLDIDWWRLPTGAGEADLLQLPVASLTPSDLGQWASMQMARGRTQPVYLLKRATPGNVTSSRSASARRRSAEPDMERVLALLRYESSDSFRLATFLSTAPFTLSVARLIQAIQFDGNTNPDMLAELMRSGVIVEAGKRTDNAAGATSGYFRVRPEACAILLRSLRRSDAAELGREVQRRVSRHIATISTSTVRSTELIADETGVHRLPSWAQPFAHVAATLLGLPGDRSAAEQRVSDLLRTFSPAMLQAVVQLAVGGVAHPKSVPPEVWAQLLMAGLVYQRTDGVWAFAPDVSDLLAGFAKRRALSPQHAKWLTAALEALQSMALAFHVGLVPPLTNDGRSVIDLMSDWTNERRAGLAHWVEMSEYVFRHPVLRVLLTGEDPLRHGDTETHRKALHALLEASALAEANDIGANQIPWALYELRNALRLLSNREPSVFEDVLIPWIEDDVRRFIDEEPESSGNGKATWLASARVVADWLQNEDVVQVVAPYCSNFFKRFSENPWSTLALSADYATYVGGLIDIWKTASQALFKLERGKKRSVDITFGVDPEYLALVEAAIPRVVIVRRAEVAYAEPGIGRSVKWSVSYDDYVTLIDKLGDTVRAALQRRLLRGPRHPRLLWVGDRSENNSFEREDILAGIGLSYTLAASTSEALLRCRSGLFDVVIFDIRRLGDSRAAYTLLDSLRQMGNKVPFVIYTGSGQPAHSAEAQKHGALGSTNSFQELERLVRQGLLCYDEVLDRTIDVQTLLQYTQYRFDGLETSDQGNFLACRAIGGGDFTTLLDVDRAVDAAANALAAYAADRPGIVNTGTDHVIVSLALVSKSFRVAYPLERDVYNVLSSYAGRYGLEQKGSAGVPGGQLHDHEATRLAQSLLDLVASDAFPDLNKAIEQKLIEAVDEGEWLIEASSHMLVESDGEYGTLQSWTFAPRGSVVFESSRMEEGVLFVTTHVALKLEVHSDFNFSVRDGIDRDMVSLGHTRASRQTGTQVDVEIAISGLDEKRPHVERVEAERIVLEVEFGIVEPDGFRDD